MLETADIFYIVVAFCVLWVTAFVCWFIYQVVMAIKIANDVMRELKWQIEKVEQALSGIKAKFESGGEHLAKLAAHIKKTVEGGKEK